MSRRMLAVVAVIAALAGIGFWLGAPADPRHEHVTPLLGTAAALVAGMAGMAASRSRPGRALLPPVVAELLARVVSHVPGVEGTRPHEDPHEEQIVTMPEPSPARVETVLREAEQRALVMRRAALERTSTRTLAELREIDQRLERLSSNHQPQSDVAMVGVSGSSPLQTPRSPAQSERSGAEELAEPAYGPRMRHRSVARVSSGAEWLERVAMVARGVSRTVTARLSPVLATVRRYVPRRIFRQTAAILRVATIVARAGVRVSADALARQEQAVSRWLIGNEYAAPDEIAVAAQATAQSVGPEPTPPAGPGTTGGPTTGLASTPAPSSMPVLLSGKRDM